MKKELADYEVRPGVVPSGKTAVVRILPRGRHARFDDRIRRLAWEEKRSPFPFKREIFEPDRNISYKIYFLPMEHNSPSGSLSVCESVMVYPGEDGSLEFTHTFGGEQEYKLVIMDPENEEKELVRLAIYSLLPDLYGKRAYRGDLHVHSYYSDGREDPLIVAANYRKRGFDFMALTDHYKIYPSQMLEDTYQDIPTDLAIFTGEEVHVPPAFDIHAVNFGGNSSVNEYYVQHQEECDAEIARIMEEIKAPQGVSPRELAMRIWVARQIKRTGGMSILVHPHWINSAYHMQDMVTDYLFEHNVYDAFELTGGVKVHSNNMQTEFYQEQRAKGRRIPIVGSSDSHGTEPEDYFTWSSCLVFAEGKSFEALTKAIEDLYSVAIESYPGEAYRVHGPYRYVKYARYLLENFFPRYDDLCWEQGRLVKEYVCGDMEALELLQIIHGRTDRFAERFFGMNA